MVRFIEVAVILDDDGAIEDEDTISLNDADDDLGVIESDEEDLNIEDSVDVTIDRDET